MRGRPSGWCTGGCRRDRTRRRLNGGDRRFRRGDGGRDGGRHGAGAVDPGLQSAQPCFQPIRTDERQDAEQRSEQHAADRQEHAPDDDRKRLVHGA